MRNKFWPTLEVPRLHGTLKCFNGFVAPSLTVKENTFMLDSGVADGIVSFVIPLLRLSRAHDQGILDYTAVSRISSALYSFSTVLLWTMLI